MPTYDYACRLCAHAFEHFQGLSEPLLVTCPACGRSGLERKIGAGIGVVFKGSGFYETDYKRAGSKNGGKSGGGEDASGGGTGAGASSGGGDGATTTPAAGKGEQAGPGGKDSKGGKAADGGPGAASSKRGRTPKAS